MSFLKKLGFSITKPQVEVTISHEMSEKNKVLQEKRKKLYETDSQDTALMYSSWIKDDVLVDLMTLHKYTCLMWGSRKFARLLNLSRNILDIEILSDTSNICEDDREPILKLLMWLSLLTPIPIKRYHLSNNAEVETKKILRELLIDKHNVFTESEYSLIEEGVFEGINVHVGNPVLDIFHDSLRFEEAQFGPACSIDWMRTQLGNNDVFRIKATRDSEANRSPDWVVYFQQNKGIDNFVDVVKAKKNAAYVPDDGISA
jgi:hypothetical protein